MTCGDFEMSLGNEQSDMKLTSEHTPENSPLHRRFKFERRSFLHPSRTPSFLFIYTHRRGIHTSYQVTYTSLAILRALHTLRSLDRGRFKTDLIQLGDWSKESTLIWTSHRCRTIHPHIVEIKGMTIITSCLPSLMSLCLLQTYCFERFWTSTLRRPICT